jgi:hypothetical protein
VAGELGFGVALGYADTLNGSYTDLATLVDVNGPPITAARVDASHHGMASRFLEKVAGLGDAGEIDAVLLFDKAQTTTLFALHRQSKFFRVKFPLLSGETTPSNWKCAGFLADLQNLTPMQDRMTVAVKIVLSGAPTFTQGS